MKFVKLFVGRSIVVNQPNSDLYLCTKNDPMKQIEGNNQGYRF